MATNTITVIAEIAGGHMGSVDRCLGLVNAAGQCGADIIKFQFYKAHELCVAGHPDYELFRSLDFSPQAWKAITGASRASGMKIYADVFGFDSLSDAADAQVDGYKIHSADMDNKELLRAVSSQGKPILMGTGGHKRIEIYQALKTLRSFNPEVPIVLMPGHQLFPTPVSEHSLDEIRWLRAAYKDMGIQVGCADHIEGSDPLAKFYPLAALGAGAVLIEKHLTMNREEKWEDYESALEPRDFKEMVALIRGLAGADTRFPHWTEGRQSYRAKMVKTPVSTRAIQKDEPVRLSDVAFLRPEAYQEPTPAEFIEGRRVLRDIGEKQALKGSDVSQSVGILINCRTASTRLPSKALKKICGKETIALLMERMKACRNAAKIVLCTTENPEDDILVEIAEREGISGFRGPNENVALRLLLASREFGFDHIVRVTGDDLLRDIRLIDEAIASHLEHNADYTCMTGVVYSCDTEIISTRALETIVERAACPENTEYLTWYLDDQSAFVCNVIQAPKEYDRGYRITLDTADDLKMFEAVFNALYVPGEALDLLAVLDYLDKHPETAQMNASSKPKLTRDQLDVSLRI